ncbi:MAG: DUF4132 domain-containing protein [Planctomycetota bacterium]
MKSSVPSLPTQPHMPAKLPSFEKGLCFRDQPKRLASEALERASEATNCLGRRLLCLDEEETSSEHDNTFLQGVAGESPEAIRALVDVIAPPLGESISAAWAALEGQMLAIGYWTIGEPADAINRATWLRDLLKELFTIELPAEANDALRHLTVFGGGFKKKITDELAQFMATLTGGTPQGGETSDHLGRLLGIEILRDSAVAEDILDTLNLIACGKHAAVHNESPSPHVARALAWSGRAEALQSLDELIRTQRPSELKLSAAITATAAAVEVVQSSPTVLAGVLQTLAGEISRGELDAESVAHQLRFHLRLPAELITQGSPDATLRTCADALSSPETRLQLFEGNDEEGVFLGSWALAATDVRECGRQLVGRYAAAKSESRDEIINSLAVFAHYFDSPTLAMRPFWIEMLRDALGTSDEHQDDVQLGFLLHFEYASGLSKRASPVPAGDDAFPLLVELGQRLKKKKRLREFVKASSFEDAGDYVKRIAKLLCVNSIGHPPEPILEHLDGLRNASLDAILDVDLSAASAEQFAQLFMAGYSHKPSAIKLCFRAVAETRDVEYLRSWSLEHGSKYSVPAAFALSLTLRPDCKEIWQSFLSAGRKEQRHHGLMLVDSALRSATGVGDCDAAKFHERIPDQAGIDESAIRSLASAVLSEYASAQLKKKRGDDLQSSTYQSAVRLSRSSEEADEINQAEIAAVQKLCQRVATLTGIDGELLEPTVVKPPQDLEVSFEVICPPEAVELIDKIDREFVRDELESIENEDLLAEWNDWTKDTPYPAKLVHQAMYILLGPGDWSSLESDVLTTARPLMDESQKRRLKEMSPPRTRLQHHDLTRKVIQRLVCQLPLERSEIVIPQLDWYESMLANFPDEVKYAGVRQEELAFPHPRHYGGLDAVFGAAHGQLSYRGDDESSRKIRERLWPLLWWTASFGNRVQELNHAAMAAGFLSDQASLGDLVKFLLMPGYRKEARHLIDALKRAEIWLLVPDHPKSQQLLSVVDAVAAICREQDSKPDSSLPQILAITWKKLPAAKGNSDIESVLRRFEDIDFQTVGRLSDRQKLFQTQLREAMSADSWYAKTEHGDVLIDFELVDRWQKQTEADLRQLLREGVVSEAKLMRIAIAWPELLRCALAAMNRETLLEAVIWILVCADQYVGSLALTLDASTGHAEMRREKTDGITINSKLLKHYDADLDVSDQYRTEWIALLTIRRDWKERAIDAHDRDELGPMFEAINHVFRPTDRKRVIGILEAFDGAFSSPAKRKKLEAAITDKPNLEFLQLALLPLPSDRKQLTTELSKRLHVAANLLAAGRKSKSRYAKEKVKLAVEQFRRSLAQNLGLKDPVQLEWLSGEAIADELKVFQRLEIDPYLIQLHLRGDGPHLLITRSGKPLKSIPAAVKKTAEGKRLVDLQKRLTTSMRDARDVFEQAMVSRKIFSPSEVKMMMDHPVIAVIAGALLFTMPPETATGRPVIGRLSEDGLELVMPKGKRHRIDDGIRVSHPLDLVAEETLRVWQNEFIDAAPQPFQQLERQFFLLDSLETAREGTCIVYRDGRKLKNEEKAFRVLEAHGWGRDYESVSMLRQFRTDQSDVRAVLPEFLCSDELGPLEFHDASFDVLPVKDVPPIVISEVLRDITRMFAAIETSHERKDTS